MIATHYFNLEQVQNALKSERIRSEALRQEVTFLLDRLDEYEAALEDTTDFQEYFGHVHASKSRLRKMTEAK